MPKKPYEPYALDFRAALRVKVKSLADEAKIIRREEHRSKNWYEWYSLKQHRKGIVRREARSAQLALAFLRGVPYEKVESYTRVGNEPNWKRVKDLVMKYAVPPHKVVLTTAQKENLLKNLRKWAPKEHMYARYYLAKID